MSSLRVHQLMERDIVVMKPSSSIREAASEFAIYGVPGAPVINKKGELIGLLTEEDIIAYIKSRDGKLIANPDLSTLNDCFTGSFRNEKVCRLYDKIGEERVENVITDEFISVGPNADAQEALETMIRFNVNYPRMNSWACD